MILQNDTKPTPEQQESDVAKSEAPQILVPFTRGSRERTDKFHDRTTALSANATQVGPEDVVARGFARHIVLKVEGTGGAQGANPAVTVDDSPFAVLSNVELQDVNGNPIVNLSGYELFLANKYGAYVHQSDPRKSPAFADVDADGNFSFVLRIPIEISGRDALGALANQNAAQTYKISYTIAPAGTAYATQPDTLPNVRVQAFLESWSQPKPTDVFGNPVAQQPPAHGTLQMWSRYVANVDAGQQTIRLPRVGNHIRNIAVVFRNGGTTRATADLPGTLTLSYDGHTVDSIDRDVLRHRVAERYGLDGADDAAGGLDSGVLVWDFCHDLDGRPGFEMRDLYLPTHQGTDLELSGSFGNAGTLTVVTNDVAAAGGIYAG